MIAQSSDVPAKRILDPQHQDFRRLAVEDENIAVAVLEGFGFSVCSCGVVCNLKGLVELVIAAAL